MLKYDFAIQTREGQKVDSIVIAGQDRGDAERKLLQMYRHCRVLSCEEKTGDGRPGNVGGAASSMEEILTLISK